MTAAYCECSHRDHYDADTLPKGDARRVATSVDHCYAATIPVGQPVSYDDVQLLCVPCAREHHRMTEVAS